MAYTIGYCLSLGVDLAGLTDLRAQLIDSDNEEVGSAVSSGFTDDGDGFYYWIYEDFPENFRGRVLIYSNADPTEILSSIQVNPEETEFNPQDLIDALSVITSGRITVVSPVLPSGRVQIVQGDAYTTALNRALTWTEVNGGWPTLTGAAITLEVNEGDLVAPGEVVVATGSNKQVKVELTTLDTEILEPSTMRYNLVATFSGGSRVTLTTDEITVLDREDE